MNNDSLKAAFVLLSVALAGCGRDHASTATTTSATTTSALTSDRILAADGLVQPYDPWDQAMSKMEGKLGKATQIDGKTYRWAAMDGDACASLAVDQMQDRGKPVVGTVEHPSKVTKNGYGYARCTAAARK